MGGHGGCGNNTIVQARQGTTTGRKLMDETRALSPDQMGGTRVKT